MALENIISELRKTRTVVLILMLVGFILYLYRGLFTEVVEYKIKPHKTINETINNNVLVQEMLNDLMVKFCDWLNTPKSEDNEDEKPEPTARVFSYLESHPETQIRIVRFLRE